jgi:hypothetical protein
MLTPVRFVTFIIAVIIALLGLLGHLGIISAVAAYDFWLVVVGFVILALGSLIKGL